MVRNSKHCICCFKVRNYYTASTVLFLKALLIAIAIAASGTIF